MSQELRALASKNCVPCSGIDPLSEAEAQKFLRDLPGWSMDPGRIWREFRFKSYLDGLEFAHNVGLIAESEDHHPNIWVGWRRVKLTFSTHSIKGLSQNDFIMAAKAELEYSKITRG
jgi:4a-hydroxytetrahydrobiopterin dehydratase